METMEKETIKIVKPIYYSTKMNKYYFNNCSVLGDYVAQTVYGGENLKGGEIKLDKNGKKFILGLLEIRKSKKTDNTYYYCIGFVDSHEDKANAIESDEGQF